MSWHISVFRKEVGEKVETLHSEADKEAYLENYQALPVFTDRELDVIRKHLERREYTHEGDNRYRHQTAGGATALLSPHSLEFMGKGDGVMEITLTALEFASSFMVPKDMFCVYDPQDDRWNV
jgi:hypothetical protein